jgi:DNA invertase Pin-like site-specific DNA recombinase
MEGDFVSYLRVSTDEQGKSGLGLEAQRAAVEHYLNGGNWRVVAEFTEVESGKRNDRPQLAAALQAARVRRCPLIVAKIDRLARSQSFLMRLIESGVDVRFCDLPKIEGATGKFMLQQMAAVEELERGLISERTKAALQAAKTRGVRVGNPRGCVMTDAIRQAGNKARSARALLRAGDVAPMIQAARDAGANSLREIAAWLNQNGIPAPRGGAWKATQIARVLKALR